MNALVDITKQPNESGSQVLEGDVTQPRNQSPDFKLPVPPSSAPNGDVKEINGDANRVARNAMIGVGTVGIIVVVAVAVVLFLWRRKNKISDFEKSQSKPKIWDEILGKENIKPPPLAPSYSGFIEEYSVTNPLPVAPPRNPNARSLSRMTTTSHGFGYDGDTIGDFSLVI